MGRGQEITWSWPFGVRSASVLIALVVASPGHAVTEADCIALTGLAVPDTTITAANLIPAGTLPENCRVQGFVDTEINFELRLPTDWNGKFYHRGRGGFAGSIGNFGPGLSRGYAEVATDTGHMGGDGSWALDRPDRQVNYGFRGIHVVTVAAKAITTAYYGMPPMLSYFEGCSNGGRQAMMEAQRFPEDFDGIVAGAPAIDFTGLMIGFNWNVQAVATAPNLHTKLPALDAASAAACDADDGLIDGVIRDAGRCAFDPSVLACELGDDNASCLTQVEVDVARKILSGPASSAGEQLHPGFHPGAEGGPGGWSAWIAGPNPGATAQFFFQDHFLRFFIFGPGYDPFTFDFDVDPAIIAPSGDFLDATDPDLSAFNARGGKLIIWHGWADPALMASRTIQYYHDVIHAMGNKHRVGEFARLFLAPGMQHCGGGPGPNRLDALTALENWVEGGVAPEHIIAERRNDEGEVEQTQPLCAYPAVAVWDGRGDPSETASFKCKNRGLGYALKGRESGD